MHGTTAPAAGATNPNEGGGNSGGGGGGGNNSLDPFTRKSSVKKLGKHQKKQQGSSRFRNQPHVEIQPLSLLKGQYMAQLFWFCWNVCMLEFSVTLFLQNLYSNLFLFLSVLLFLYFSIFN